MQVFKLKDGDSLEFYKDNSGEYRWRVTASDGEEIAAAIEGYSSKVNAQSSFERDRRHDDVEVYIDKAGEYRWRARSSNGNIVAACRDGYTHKGACIWNLERCAYTLGQITSEAD